MALASDLMGLGLPGMLAQQMATGGIGPVTITAAGSAFSTATRIKCDQRLVLCTNADGTVAVSLPIFGTDNGALIGDQFIISNAHATNSLQIFGSSGVLICGNGSNGSQYTALACTNVIMFPVTSTQWVAVKGA